MTALWACNLGFHRWRRSSHLPRSLHNYRTCTRCFARSVVRHPLEVRLIDWNWVEGGAPNSSNFATLNQEPSVKPNLTIAQAEAVIETKKAPKVTRQGIEAKIASVQYITQHAPLTICVITMRNGFSVTGTSGAVSLANYDEEVGKTVSYENAFRQIWPLEGYLLRERLAAEEAL